MLTEIVTNILPELDLFIRFKIIPLVAFGVILHIYFTIKKNKSGNEEANRADNVSKPS